MAFIYVLFGLLWSLAICALFAVAMIHLVDGGSPLIGWGAAVGSLLLTAALITAASKSDDTAFNQCLRHGGAWAIVGRHTELQYNAALKMAVPTEATEYGRVDRAR